MSIAVFCARASLVPLVWKPLAWHAGAALPGGTGGATLKLASESAASDRNDDPQATLLPSRHASLHPTDLQTGPSAALRRLTKAIWCLTVCRNLCTSDGHMHPDHLPGLLLGMKP